MSLFEFFLIGVGLSMDAFAVSITKGLTVKNINKRKTFLIALFFGGFQALMPLLGWLIGIHSSKYTTNFNYWIAFLLLFYIGFKMIKESIECEEETCIASRLSMRELLALSIATSIDALATGVSFAYLNVKIVEPVIIIGLTTFFFSILGVRIGKYFGEKYKKNAQIFGGAILILIGFKILISHYL